MRGEERERQRERGGIDAKSTERERERELDNAIVCVLYLKTIDPFANFEVEI